MGMVLCFGTITFTATAMAARTFLLGDSRAILAASNFKFHYTASPVENSFVSIFVLLYHFMLLGLFLLLSYIIQHHPPFPHGDRASFDPDYLAFLVFLMMFFAFTTVRRNDGRDRNHDRQNAPLTQRNRVNLIISITNYTCPSAFIGISKPSDRRYVSKIFHIFIVTEEKRVKTTFRCGF